jgi:thioredoxin 1
MSDPADNNDSSNWIKVIGAGLVALLCLLFIGKNFLPPKDPKFVTAINYEQLQSLNQTPCIVYFYHKSTDESVRMMMPALDELASRFKDKLGFYRYQFSDPEEKLSSKTDYQSTFTIYNDGKEIKNYPVTQFASAIDVNEGLILLMIKDYVVKNNADLPRQEATPYVTAADFPQHVLASARPVIVDFTSAYCPACEMLQPQFKQIAAKDSNLADFYFFDNNSPANHSIVNQYFASATPTVMLFYMGKPQGRFSGAFSSSDLNEGHILWLLQSYF